MKVQRIAKTKYHIIEVDGAIVGKAWLNLGKLNVKVDGHETLVTNGDTIQSLTETVLHFAYSTEVEKVRKPKAEKQAKKPAKKSKAKKTAEKTVEPKARRPRQMQLELQMAV